MGDYHQTKWTTGTAGSGFVSRPAANSVFLLPFWEALCSLLIPSPAPVDFKRHAPDKALSLLKPCAQDMARMELIFFLAARMVLF